jgi:hypothetical protein
MRADSGNACAVVFAVCYFGTSSRTTGFFTSPSQNFDFQILHWRKAGYAAAPNRDGWLASRVFSRSFQLTRKRDRAGNWLYQLGVREN